MRSSDVVRAHMGLPIGWLLISLIVSDAILVWARHAYKGYSTQVCLSRSPLEAYEWCAISFYSPRLSTIRLTSWDPGTPILSLRGYGWLQGYEDVFKKKRGEKERSHGCTTMKWREHLKIRKKNILLTIHSPRYSSRYQLRVSVNASFRDLPREARWPFQTVSMA